MRHDRIAGALLSLGAGLFLFEARSFETGFIADPIGPKAFPYVLGTALLVLSMWLLVRPEADASWPPSGFWWKWGVAAASLFVYAAILRSLGFLLSTTLLLTLFSVLLGGRLVRSAIFGLVFSASVHFVFGRLLALALPPGSVFLGVG